MGNHFRKPGDEQTAQQAPTLDQMDASSSTPMPEVVPGGEDRDGSCGDKGCGGQRAVFSIHGV